MEHIFNDDFDFEDDDYDDLDDEDYCDLDPLDLWEGDEDDEDYLLNEGNL